MYVRGIRGANTVENNTENEILDATKELLHEIVAQNSVKPEDICSVLITVTHDLDAAFPASVIRQMKGWELVPLMCSLEINVPSGLQKCIRFMVQVNTEKAQSEMVHVYMNKAKKLRPDLSQS